MKKMKETSGKIEETQWKCKKIMLLWLVVKMLRCDEILMEKFVKILQNRDTSWKLIADD